MPAPLIPFFVLCPTATQETDTQGTIDLVSHLAISLILNPSLSFLLQTFLSPLSVSNSWSQVEDLIVVHLNTEMALFLVFKSLPLSSALGQLLITAAKASL